MSVHQLAVAANTAEGPASRSDQILRLQALTRSLAAEQVMALEDALANVSALSREIVESKDIYPSGIVQLAERLLEEGPWNVKTISVIRARTLGAREETAA
jgi:hypothetical protein